MEDPGDKPRRKRDRSRSEAAESGPKRLSLGVTTGMMAAGAWKARMEILEMLENGADPADVITLIRRGEEGKELEAQGARTEVGSTTPRSHLTEDESGHDDWELTRATQRSIVEAVGGNEDVLPPWARSGENVFKPSGTSTGSRGETFPRREKPSFADPPRELFGGKKPTTLVFAKPARPPPSRQAQENFSSNSEPAGEPSRIRGAEPGEVPEFRKKASPPPKVLEIGSGGLGYSGPKTSLRGDASMGEREKSDLKKYFSDTHAIYSFLGVKGVSLDLKEIVEKDGIVDGEKFKLLTAPSRASAGLGYSRLMRRFIDWRLDRKDLDREEGTPDQKLGILDFVIFLTQNEVGRMTPRAFMYAWEFFGKALGYQVEGPHWGRAKRLCSQYAQIRDVGVSKAPAFTKATMIALESTVLNEDLDITHRIAAGKLRLCIQASIRHSDMQNTPLSLCEWVRKPGSELIIGLRSRARRGKTGPRLWIISLRGASASGDGWVQKLMELLLKSHGTDWRYHDYMGRMPSGILGEFLAGPSRIEIDVRYVREALEKHRNSGGDIGMSSGELLTLRWHGAKASMSSVMQHLNVPPKVVRVQGAWRNKEDAMADSYLRAAQILVLEAQERCLSYLRSGGDLPHLTGEPLSESAPKGDHPAADKKRAEEAMAAPKHFAVGKESLAAELFNEDDFDEEKKLKDEVLSSELGSPIGEEEASKLLDDYSPGTPLDTEPEEEWEGAVPVLKSEKEDLNAAEIQEKFDMMDSEGMILALVQARAATPNSKLHLPFMDPEDSDLPPLALPRCGVKGVYDYIHAEETLSEDHAVCVRCLPGHKDPAGCQSICGQLALTSGVPTLTMRCSRRCGLGPEPHTEHRCIHHSRDGAES